MKYGEPRYTKDLDIWVNNSAQNSRRVLKALKKFGAPLDHDGITPERFTERLVVYQIGIAPVRVDILTEITGVKFADAWKKKGGEHFLQRSSTFHFLRRSGSEQTSLGSQQRPSRPEIDPQEVRGITRTKSFFLDNRIFNALQCNA